MGYVKGDTVFDLQKTISLKNRAESLKILNALLNEGVQNHQKILPAIASRLRQLLLLKQYLNRGVAQKEAIEKAGSNFFYNRYLLDAVGKHGTRELVGKLLLVMESDMEIKSGKKPLKFALEILVSELCRPGQ
jgi:DNA polymerase III delta subunit